MSQIFIATLGATNAAMFVGESLRKEFSCDKIKIKGAEWLIPVATRGILNGYERVMDTVKPQPDAVKAIRFRMYDGDDYWILVEDSFDEADLADICNGCCGSTPSVTNPTIPVPIIENCPCISDSDTYTFIAPFPNNVIDDSITTPVTLDYKIVAAFNGEYATPDLSGNSYADSAAVLAAAQANWGDYGTWTINADGNLQLVSDENDNVPVTCAMINVELIPGVWCAELPDSPTAANNILIGGEQVDFNAVLFSTANPSAAFYALKPILGNEPNILEIVQVGSPAVPFLQYTGYQAPGDVQNDAVVVTTFTAGACA